MSATHKEGKWKCLCLSVVLAYPSPCFNSLPVKKKQGWIQVHPESIRVGFTAFIFKDVCRHNLFTDIFDYILI